MRSKTPLFLMEQVVMALVFALAAALCLRAFVYADALSARNTARDQAVLQAESAAEVLKHCRGDLEQAAGLLGGTKDDTGILLEFSEDWKTAAVSPAFLLKVRLEESGQPYLGQAQVEVTDAGGELLIRLPVRWQEVASHG